MQSLKTRLVKGIGANFFGQLVIVGIQLGSVPLFLHFWGKAMYGEWLILSAIPTYLSMSDVGFSSVAGNEMTMLTARGNRKAAVEVFQSVWVMVSTISLFFSVAVVVLLWILPVKELFHIALISPLRTKHILLILSIYTLLSLQGGIFDAGFRCDGNYALGTLLGSVVRLVDWMFGLCVLICGGGPVAIALALLSGRLIGLGINWHMLRKRSEWLRFGYKEAKIEIFRRLLKPALSFMSFPLGQALSIQGMTLVVGNVLGPVAVATFTTYRTASRTVVQLISMINRAIWPEISSAYGLGNLSLARQLHAKASSASFWSATVFSLLLSMVGQRIIDLWTNRNFSENTLLFNVLLSVTVANALWQTSWVALMATNRHNKIAGIFVTASFASIVIAPLWMKQIGISGAALALLLIDSCMVFFTIKNALSILEDDVRTYLRQTLTFFDAR